MMALQAITKSISLDDRSGFVIPHLIFFSSNPQYLRIYGTVIPTLQGLRNHDKYNHTDLQSGLVYGALSELVRKNTEYRCLIKSSANCKCYFIWEYCNCLH